MKRHALTGTLLAGLLLFGFSSTASLSQPLVTLSNDSELWIEGTSSVNSFTCIAGRVSGEGSFVENRAGRIAEAVVSVPVEAFDCGKSRMNRDFTEALRADSHPWIEFRLEKVELSSRDAESGADNVRVTGRLLIAGSEQTVAIDVLGQLGTDSTYRATGSLPLLMSDFGIQPPTALFGLIRAHDPITVHFDLLASVRAPNHTH